MQEIPPQSSPLAPYLPRLVREWSERPEGPRARTIAGSLVSVDISGFTALAERLATKGRAGAEELVLCISDVFDRLIEVAERHGGDVLKFRGDALLLLFTDDRHPERACGAASDMQWTIEEVGSAASSVGPAELRMSAGVHSGACHVFLTETPHRELLVAGPAATRVVELENLAAAGKIVISAETAGAVDPSWLRADRDGAHVMARLEPGASTIPALPAAAGRDLHEYVPRPLRDHLAVASGEAEHRQVTVAFVKLPGTDELLSAGGPAAVLARIDEVAEAVGRACDTFGPTWLESDVDVGAVKLYLTGGAPSTSGDDEEGMVRALRAVLEACAGLGLRAGVNRGHVFTGDIGNARRRTYAVMGDAVNLAARLTARAGPELILATADVLDRARTVYHTETEPLLVKGKERAVTAHAIGDPMGPRPTSPPDLTPVVGRDVELEQIRLAIDRARMRHLDLVELVAEPGMGKSRLVQEVRTLALGFQQLEAAAEHYSSGEPYAAFRGLLRQLVGITSERSRAEAGAQLASFVSGTMPDLAPWLPLLAVPFDAEVEPTAETSALDPAASRDRLHAVVETFLERILMMPTLIVVEDAHWLDDASRFLLQSLVARPAARPWLVCVTTRPGAASFVHPDGPGTRIALEPLTGTAAEQLAIAVAEQFALSVDHLHSLVERSGGNPLFVRELVLAARHGEALERLPETVESLLTARIDTLDPADRMLLRYAAVIGPAFGLDLLGEILEREIPGAGHPERWAYLGEFVVPADGETLSFRHDLVRATAYEGLSFRRRREIHGRVGEALERRAGARADEEAALLSLHFFEAGENERAWRYSVLAGARAEAGFANVVAAVLYERALAAAALAPGVVSESEQARVCEALGDVYERFGAYEQASSAFTRAGELVVGDAVAETRLVAKGGVVHERSGRYAEALAAYATALRRLDEVDDPRTAELRARIGIGQAGIHYRQARYEESIEAALDALAHAEAAGDLSQVAHACYVLDAAYTDLGTNDGLPYLERALPLYEDLHDFRGQGIVLNNLGVHAYYEGRWDEALSFYRQSREAKERVGDVIGAAVQMNNEAEILSDQGHYVDATPLLEDWLRASRASGYAFGIGVALSNLGRVAARASRFADAHHQLDQALAQFDLLASERFANETRARIAECLVFEGRHGEAVELGSACREAAARSPVGGLEALIERTIGYALCQARRPAEARPHLEASLRLARDLHAEFEVALTLRAMAAVGWEDGAALRAESDAILERLGVVRVPAVPLP